MAITGNPADNMTYAQLQRLFTIAKEHPDGLFEAFASAYNMGYIVGYDAAMNDQSEQE